MSAGRAPTFHTLLARTSIEPTKTRTSTKALSAVDVIIALYKQTADGGESFLITSSEQVEVHCGRVQVQIPSSLQPL